MRLSDFRLYADHLGDYMRRWILQTPWGTLRIHNILRSDHDHDLHDHPWDFTSLLIKGSYTEVDMHGARHWPRWSVVRRKATDLHRLVLETGPVWTLVVSTKKLRSWGFDVNGRWIPWRVYCGVSR